MFILLFLLSCVHAYQESHYILSDIQYPVPFCMGMKNQYGKVELRTTLFDYNQFRLKLELEQNLTSCNLCRIDQKYCNFSIGSEYYGLTSDFSYNTKVILNDGSEEFRFFLLPPERNSIILRGNESWCGKTVRFILLSYFNLWSPVHRDFLLTMVNPTDNRTVPCQTFLSRTGLCHTAPFFHFIDYPYTNCLEEVDDVIGLPTNEKTQKTPFYFYKHRSVKVPKNRYLCGESWFSILNRSNLDIYCDPELLLYVKPKAWYESAVLFITAKLNGNHQKEVWILENLLERSCLQRDTGVALEETLFWPYLEKLDGPLRCLNMSNFTSHPMEKNITLPFYVRNYKKWFWKGFHYLLESKEGMLQKASLLLSLPFILSLVAVISIGLTIYHVYFRRLEDYEELGYQPLEK